MRGFVKALGEGLAKGTGELAYGTGQGACKMHWARGSGRGACERHWVRGLQKALGDGLTKVTGRDLAKVTGRETFEGHWAKAC